MFGVEGLGASHFSSQAWRIPDPPVDAGEVSSAPCPRCRGCRETNTPRLLLGNFISGNIAKIHP